MTTERTPFLAPLTGIRFIAAIFVFNAHVAPPVGAPAVLGAISLSGHNWMTMFFVLSGLILTWNYDRVLGDRLTARGLRTYYVARLARIYPLYLAALLFAIFPLATGADVVGLITSREFWVHVLALQAWSPDLLVAYGFNGPGWSIGVELFLYALFPLLLVAFRRIRRNPRALLVVGILAVVAAVALTLAFTFAGLADLPRTDPASGHRWIYRTPLTRLPDFVLGIVLGYLALSAPPVRARAIGLAAQATGAISVLAMMAFPSLSTSLWSLDAANMIPFALIMIGLVWRPDSVLARALGTRTMVFLGECSFAFYLLHQSIVKLVGLPTLGWINWGTTWVLAFVLTLIASAGAHLFIERPARVAIRRMLDRPPPSIARSEH